MTALTLSAKNRLAHDARPRKAVGQESRRSEDLSSNRRMPMKYMLTWTERPQGSPIEYENAQKRILEVFTQWKAPDNFKIEMFVIRVGDWGGYTFSTTFCLQRVAARPRPLGFGKSAGRANQATVVCRPEVFDLQRLLKRH